MFFIKIIDLEGTKKENFAEIYILERLFMSIRTSQQTEFQIIHSKCNKKNHGIEFIFGSIFLDSTAWNYN